MKVKVWMHVEAVGDYSLEKIPTAELVRLRKSQFEAARALALKDVEYNRSVAQTGGRNDFDRAEFAFLSGWLPAKHEVINAAIEANDLQFFVDFGKKVQRLLDRRKKSGDALGHLLVENWVAQPQTKVPSFCLFNPAVLVEACKACLQNPKLSKTQINTAVKNLKLIRISKTHEALLIQHFSYKGTRLRVSSQKLVEAAPAKFAEWKNKKRVRFVGYPDEPEGRNFGRFGM